MYKIMIVEDDRVIAQVLNQSMEKWGFSSTFVTDFTNITEQFAKEQPQIVLMDIALPYFNGYYWCAEIRKISKVPIIFISSNSSNMDIVMAMNMGGDDFIVKPFDLDVVVAKVQAVLRRAYSYQGQTTMLTCKGAILNIGETALYYKEQKIELTKNEFRILNTLMEQPGNVVSRDQIMRKLWDDECFIDDNTLTVNMTRLRRKLEDMGLHEFILTKKGMGYLIDMGESNER